MAQACGSEDETKYGGPSGLSNRKVADPPSAAPTGTTNPNAVAACDDAGLSTSTATCGVSFATTIFGKYMAATGTWKCTDSSCHGPTGSSGTSANAPTIDGTDPKKAYAALATYRFQGKMYINACSIDPSASGMDSNLTGAAQPKMPQSGAGVSPPGATPDELTDLETWLKCGAPDN
ncbi:MAG: hypothetical protein ABI461_00960 [Polyangiaceae bacterium]